MTVHATIRPAESADLPGILAIFAADDVGGHAEYRGLADMAAYEQVFDRIAASSDNALFVALVDRKIVGTFQLTFIPGLVNHGLLRAKLESVHVLAENRSQGIGEQMVRHALDEARRRGAGMMELSSNKKRLAAHRFYERLGFARSHEAFKLML